jgi:hypothetical protein
MSKTYSPAQIYAMAAGIVLLALGALGFIASSSFNTGVLIQGQTFLFFEVNGWLNTLYLILGIVGVLTAGTYRRARVYAMVVGILLTVIQM